MSGQGRHTRYPWGFGDMYLVLQSLGLHLGDLLPSPVISPTGMSPSKQMLGTYHILLIQRVSSILGFREDATSSPAHCSAPSGAPASLSVGCAAWKQR